jgi:hypothetical protein
MVAKANLITNEDTTVLDFQLRLGKKGSPQLTLLAMYLQSSSSIHLTLLCTWEMAV